MSELFELAMPWWEFVLRAVVVYFALLVMIRVSGKRTVGQFTPFDLILVVLLGNAVQNSLLGEDTSLLGGLVLAGTLIALNWTVGALSARSKKLDRFFEGSPVLLAREGEVFRRALRRQNIGEADFAEAMRESDIASEDEIGIAVLETNGKISIVKRDGEQAVLRSDVPGLEG